MPEITELTNKYIVIPTKYLVSPTIRFSWFYNQDHLRVHFKSYEYLTQYEQKDTRYFVMKLEDEFNLEELYNRLGVYGIRSGIRNVEDIKIKGSDLALIILNSITDKGKLK